MQEKIFGTRPPVTREKQLLLHNSGKLADIGK